MVIRYPNGKEYINNKIHYNSTTSSNRGMTLEKDINNANIYYRTHNIAIIYKKPIPIQIVNVSYPTRNKAEITKAFFRQPSTTDYNGIYKGNYIDFDAKETQNLKSFPLSNIHEHQISHLQNIINQRGLAFLIIRFTNLHETFVVSAELIIKYWNNKSTGPKSIPYDVISKLGCIIKNKLNPSLPYLDAVQFLMDN